MHDELGAGWVQEETDVPGSRDEQAHVADTLQVHRVSLPLPRGCCHLLMNFYEDDKEELSLAA